MGDLYCCMYYVIHLTPEDVVITRETFRKYAPPAWRSLLDAPKVEGPNG